MVRVRDAQPGDRDAIEKVTLAAYRQYASAMPAHWERYRDNIVGTLAAAPPGTQIVAEDAGRVTGAVVLYPAGSALQIPGGGGGVALDVPEVRLLAVLPEARGRGVGAALMGECIERARRSGAPALTLHTTDMMAAAVRLYERIGFERAPELDIEPAPGITAKGYRISLEKPRGATAGA